MANLRPRLVALDGLRGLAALAAVLFHCCKALHPRAAWSFRGYLPVNISLCFSGFVLAMAHVDAFRSARLGSGRFVLAR